jgi:hypothetical protein
MSKFIYAAALAALVTACGAGRHPGASNPLILPPAYGTPANPVQSAATAGECRSAGLGRFRGQPGNSATGAEMLRVSGARTIRWVQPGQMVTMDFSPQRLTVYLAKGTVIDRATCG